MTLIEALQNIEIELVPGRVYNFEAEGCQIELRVRPVKHPARPMNLEADTMLDAWVEFPFHGEKIISCRPAKGPVWPDPIVIEEDEST